MSESRPGANFEAKPITREYADALRAAGLHIVSNFQYGKPGGTAPSDFTRGFDGGVADARTALRLHSAAGGSDSAPIFFSVDDDINVDTWNGLAVNWFRGINSVLGTARTGIYGHFQACQWATNDGVIGHSTTAGHQWAWQTKSWSHGQRESTAVLYQEVVDTPSNPSPLLGGIHIDVDEVLAPILVRFLVASTSTSTRCSPPTSANGISVDDLVLVSGGFHEISSTGGAFVRRYHLRGNVASSSEVFRCENRRQVRDQ